jgi:hypothetical protein
MQSLLKKTVCTKTIATTKWTENAKRCIGNWKKRMRFKTVQLLK